MRLLVPVLLATAVALALPQLFDAITPFFPMVFSGGRKARDCVCGYVKSICNAVVEGRRWDRRVFYEDVAAAAGLAGGLLEITAVILIATLPQPQRGILLIYYFVPLVALALVLGRPAYVADYNSVIRVASCGLPAKYLAVAFINEVRGALVIILLFIPMKITEQLGLAGISLGVALAWIVARSLYATYLQTFHCLKFAHKEVVKERCGERGVAEAFGDILALGWIFIPNPPRLSYCCKEARVWLYRNVPEARRAALIYDATLNGLRAVAVAYALYVALRG
ncbi:MAG: hypothetical protein QXR18_10875 [Pyrobaculum sp.]